MTQTPRAARFARNSLHFLLGEGSVLVVTMAVIPPLVHALGTEGYALYAFMGIMAGYMSLFTLGAGPTAVKLVSESVATRDEPRLWRAANLSFWGHLGGAIVAALALIASRDYLTSKFLHITPAVMPQAHRIFSYTAAGGFAFMMSLWSASVLQGFQRFDLYNVLSVMRGSLVPAGCLALALAGRPLGDLGVWFFAANALVFILGFFWSARLLLPAYRARRARGRGHEWGTLAAYNVAVIASQVSWSIGNQLDKLWVGAHFPIGDLAYYVIPSSLAQRLGTVPAIVGQVVFPMASEISGLGHAESLKRLYLKATKVILLALLPFFIVLFAFAPQVLAVWLGPDFEARGAWPMRLLLIGSSASIVRVVAHHVAFGLGKVGSITATTIANALLSLGLWWYLIPRYGIIGAAGGFCLAQILVVAPFLLYVNRALVGVSLGEFLADIQAPCLTGLLIAGVAYLLRSRVFHFFPLAVVTAAILAAYYGMNFFLLGTEERELVLRIIKIE